MELNKKNRVKITKEEVEPYKNISAYEWDNPEYFREIDILSLLPTKKLKEIEKDFPKTQMNSKG